MQIEYEKQITAAFAKLFTQRNAKGKVNYAKHFTFRTRKGSLQDCYLKENTQ